MVVERRGQQQQREETRIVAVRFALLKDPCFRESANQHVKQDACLTCLAFEKQSLQKKSHKYKNIELAWIPAWGIHVVWLLRWHCLLLHYQITSYLDCEYNICVCVCGGVEA